MVLAQVAGAGLWARREGACPDHRCHDAAWSMPPARAEKARLLRGSISPARPCLRPRSVCGLRGWACTDLAGTEVERSTRPRRTLTSIVRRGRSTRQPSGSVSMSARGAFGRDWIPAVVRTGGVSGAGSWSFAVEPVAVGAGPWSTPGPDDPVAPGGMGLEAVVSRHSAARLPSRSAGLWPASASAWWSSGTMWSRSELVLVGCTRGRRRSGRGG